MIWKPENKGAGVVEGERFENHEANKHEHKTGNGRKHCSCVAKTDKVLVCHFEKIEVWLSFWKKSDLHIIQFESIGALHDTDKKFISGESF